MGWFLRVDVSTRPRHATTTGDIHNRSSSAPGRIIDCWSESLLSFVCAAARVVLSLMVRCLLGRDRTIIFPSAELNERYIYFLSPPLGDAFSARVWRLRVPLFLYLFTPFVLFTSSMQENNRCSRGGHSSLRPDSLANWLTVRLRSRDRPMFSSLFFFQIISFSFVFVDSSLS